jgi:hypothetical protein
MGGSGSGKAPGLGLDHGAEGVAAERALLLQVVTDFGERVVVQCLVQ